MIIGWLLSLLLVWTSPSLLAVFNPFLAPISQAIQRRTLYRALWGAYLTGLLRDIILSSPRLGLLGLSSLVTSAMTYRLACLLSLEGWQGSFVVAMLAVMEFFIDTVFCCIAGGAEGPSFSSVWSWKSYFLFVVFACLWACFLGCIAVARRWYITHKRRTSS